MMEARLKLLDREKVFNRLDRPPEEAPRLSAFAIDERGDVFQSSLARLSRSTSDMRLDT
jgi:hypothetical protein